MSPLFAAINYPLKNSLRLKLTLKPDQGMSLTFGPSWVDLGPELFTACLVVVVLPLGTCGLHGPCCR